MREATARAQECKALCTCRLLRPAGPFLRPDFALFFALRLCLISGLQCCFPVPSAQTEQSLLGVQVCPLGWVSLVCRSLPRLRAPLMSCLRRSASSALTEACKGQQHTAEVPSLPGTAATLLELLALTSGCVQERVRQATASSLRLRTCVKVCATGSAQVLLHTTALHSLSRAGSGFPQLITRQAACACAPAPGCAILLALSLPSSLPIF